ncbi:MAG: GNAT family N-acetyltransferase [Chthoniobacteraceae bacterium]
MTAIIHSERLDLIPMTPAVLRAMLAGNSKDAGQLLGLSVPTDWDISRDAIELRLSQLDATPGLQSWLLRAISWREQGVFVGHIGFHSAPGHESLAELSPGGVEFGYGILEPWRRRGIATEACAALMRWARERHQVTRFVVSISPNNLPSLGLAAKLGFRKIGSHIDEEDGPEDIFERADPSSERFDQLPRQDSTATS